MTSNRLPARLDAIVDRSSTVGTVRGSEHRVDGVAGPAERLLMGVCLGSSYSMTRTMSSGLPATQIRYSITAKRLPLLLLLPHSLPLPPLKRIRRLATGWPCHWS
jgi:hypothetical protein